MLLLRVRLTRFRVSRKTLLSVSLFLLVRVSSAIMMLDLPIMVFLLVSLRAIVFQILHQKPCAKSRTCCLNHRIGLSMVTVIWALVLIMRATLPLLLQAIVLTISPTKRLDSISMMTWAFLSVGQTNSVKQVLKR